MVLHAFDRALSGEFLPVDADADADMDSIALAKQRAAWSRLAAGAKQHDGRSAMYDYETDGGGHDTIYDDSVSRKENSQTAMIIIARRRFMNSLIHSFTHSITHSPTRALPPSLRVVYLLMLHRTLPSRHRAGCLRSSHFLSLEATRLRRW